jgi:hypothetical protein
LGDYPLRDITPLVVEDVLAQLAGQGASPDARRRPVTLLQGILKRSVVRGLIPANPVQLVTKPNLPPVVPPRPLAPESVEAIRAGLRLRDAMIVSLLSYGCLRPVEDRGSRWGDPRDRTLHVYATKTGRPRDVDLLTALAKDHAEWARVKPTGRRGTDRSPSVGRRVDAGGLGELAPADLAPRGARRRRHRRPAPVPAARLVRLAAALGGSIAAVRGRAGGPFGGHPGPALRRGDQRSSTARRACRRPK